MTDTTPAASQSNRRALVHNAITNALSDAGDWVPLNVRIAATRAALAEVDAWHEAEPAVSSAVVAPPTDQTTPSHRAGLRDEIVNALGRITTTPPIAHRRAQADHVLAVLCREWPWLRAEAEDAAPTDHTTPPAWVDGHPQLEAIAAAVWEQCGRSDNGACVDDDPRNIAVAALSAVRNTADDQAAENKRLRAKVFEWQGSYLDEVKVRQERDAEIARLRADRAAVLRWAADRYDRSDRIVKQMFGHQVAAELRRLADQAQPEPGARHVHITIHHPDPTTTHTAAHAIADLIHGEYGDSLRLTITTDAPAAGTHATTTVAPSPARSNATPPDVATATAPSRPADETATETPAAEPTAEDIAREHVTSLHLIGEQLATIESWFWEHLADVRDAGARQDERADDVVTELTEAEFHTAAGRALARLGLTYAELEDQARRRDFSSAQARSLWVTIGGAAPAGARQDGGVR